MRTQFKNDSKQCKTCTHREQLEMESGPTKTIKRIVRCKLTAHIPMTLVCVCLCAQMTITVVLISHIVSKNKTKNEIDIFLEETGLS